MDAADLVTAWRLHLDGRDRDAAAVLNRVAPEALETAGGARDVLRLANEIGASCADLRAQCSDLAESARAAVSRHGVVIRRAKYLGGHPDLGTSKSGLLKVASAGIELCWSNGPTTLKKAVPIDTLDYVGIEGGMTGESRFWPVVAFGILGLAASEVKNQSYLMAHTKSGACAIFEIDSLSGPRLRSEVAPVLDLLGIDIRSEGGAGGGQP